MPRRRDRPRPFARPLGRTSEALEWLNKAAAQGVGTDPAALTAAFGSAADAPDVRALLSRFRGNLTPVVRSTLAFRRAERDLMPESVAYDPADDTYSGGSLYRRKIVAVRNGVARDFVTAKRDGLTSVLGMKIDRARRELWANWRLPERHPLERAHSQRTACPWLIRGGFETSSVEVERLQLHVSQAFPDGREKGAWRVRLSVIAEA